MKDAAKTVNGPGDAMPQHKQIAMGKKPNTGGSNKVGPKTPA